MTLGENIKRIRKMRGITQSDLAKKLEVTARTIQNYESGNREPNLETLMKICDTLDCAPMEIIDLTEFENLKNNDANIIPTNTTDNLHDAMKPINDFINFIISDGYEVSNLDNKTIGYLYEKVTELLEFEFYKLEKNNLNLPDDK